MIKINNKIFSLGKNISISNGVVYVDGKKIEQNEKKINIVVNGSINKIEADCCEKIEVKGNCEKVVSTNGDVTVGGNVLKNVQTTNGDVDCGNVGGNVKTTNGDIKHRR